MAFTTAMWFFDPIDFVSTFLTPAASSTARTPPPAMSPVPVDAGLTVAGIAAAQEVVVPPDAGANVKITLRRPRGGLQRARE